MLTLFVLAACAKNYAVQHNRPAPAYPVRRVTRRETFASFLEADRAGVIVGVADLPLYVLFADPGGYCLTTQRTYARTVIGDGASCDWRPRR